MAPYAPSMSAPIPLRQHEIPGVATFNQGPGGLMCLDVRSTHSTARIFLHGAHVASFQRNGEAPLLFMSRESYFATGKPIRGGIPVIFPWFGPRADDPSSPAHGFARTEEWAVESITEQEDGSVQAVFTLASSPETLALWPFEFLLRYKVSVGQNLELSLTVVNRASEPFVFEDALHTYFTVSDIQQVSVTGLHGAEYIDKVDGFKRKKQESPGIQFSGETDRVYVNTLSTCIADDAGMSRRLIVEKHGSATTVVWNPWIAKSAALPDFGDDEWPGMLCIETANAADNRISLLPGEEHEMAAVIRAENA